MPVPIIRIETLRGLAEVIGGTQVVEMFSRSLRIAHGPDASEAQWSADPRVASRAAIGAAEMFWLALIAALVALSSSPGANSSRGLTGSSPGCLFVGKGGAICNKAAIAARKIAAEDRDPCVSLGKGGRFCPPAKLDAAAQ
jgi:hypothetical protein